MDLPLPLAPGQQGPDLLEERVVAGMRRNPGAAGERLLLELVGDGAHRRQQAVDDRDRGVRVLIRDTRARPVPGVVAECGGERIHRTSPGKALSTSSVCGIVPPDGVKNIFAPVVVSSQHHRNQ